MNDVRRLVLVKHSSRGNRITQVRILRERDEITGQ